MKHKSKLITALPVFLALTFPASSIGAASGEEPPWLQCEKIERHQQLDCYTQATKRYRADREQAASTPASDAVAVADTAGPDYDWKLDRLWPVGSELAEAKALAGVLLQYRGNYLMLDSVHSPSSSPYSPNVLNQVPQSGSLTSAELKLQVSLKSQLPIVWPWGDSVWIAYTQQSQWQAFNKRDSRPFRETNYEPELIYLSRRFDDKVPTFGAWTPRVLNLTYVHQSNGQALPRSRSWNRFTAQFGSEYRFDDNDDRRLTLMLRPWWRVPDRNNDDNPDIVKYLGHGDITLDYWRGRQQFSLLLRERAFQLSWAFPLYEPALNSANLYLQYFSGYGHSLIDYNHKLDSFGLGISLPF